MWHCTFTATTNNSMYLGYRTETGILWSPIATGTHAWMGSCSNEEVTTIGPSVVVCENSYAQDIWMDSCRHKEVTRVEPSAQ